MIERRALPSTAPSGGRLAPRNDSSMVPDEETGGLFVRPEQANCTGPSDGVAIA